MLLLRPSRIALVRRWTDRLSPKQATRAFVLLMLALIVMVSMFRGAAWVAVEMQRVTIDAFISPELLIGAILTFLSALLLFSSIAHGYGAFFQSHDLDCILSSPVPTANFLISRFLQTTFATSWMPLLFGVPMIAGIGSGFSVPRSFYWGMLGLLPLYTAVNALGCAIAIVISLFLSKAFFKLLLKIGIVVFVGWAFYYISSALKVEGSDLTLATDRILGLLKVSSDDALPPAWVSRLFFAAGRGEIDYQAIFSLLGFLTFSIGLLLLMGIALYRISRSVILSSSAAPSRGILSLARLTQLLPQSVRPIIAKDIISIVRDPSSLAQLAPLLVLSIIYLSQAQSIHQLMLSEVPALRVLAFGMHIVLGVFIMLGFASRFIVPLFSLDGEYRWVLLSSPFLLSRVVFIRWAWSSVICTLLGGIILLGAPLLWSGGIAQYLSYGYMSILGGVVVSAIACALGAAYARFDWEQPHELVASLTSMSFMILALLYLGLLVSAGVALHFVFGPALGYLLVGLIGILSSKVFIDFSIPRYGRRIRFDAQALQSTSL